MKYVIAIRPIDNIGTDDEASWAYKTFDNEEEANDFAQSQHNMQVAYGTTE